MWSIYDDLIDGIPAHLTVDECVVGLYWTCIVSEGNAGIAMTVNTGCGDGFSRGSCIGKPLREVAEYAKSWNMVEATIGMAAINAYYNTPENMQNLGIDRDTGSGESIFTEPLEYLLGKKVAVIGHFPRIEKNLGGICDLSVLERKPSGNDFLDSACEYILPEQEVVFITGVTFTNKTLPRLLELTRNARTVMVGPTVPVTPILFHHGVDSVAGFYVTDIGLMRNLVSQAAYFQIFKCGGRVVYDLAP